jgi:protoheme IX farnesyltransferase
MKPRIGLLVLVTVWLGGYVVSTGRPNAGILWNAVMGTGLIAAAAGVLNHLAERDLDAKMSRTSRRPLPSGRVSPTEALTLGSILLVMGVGYLSITTHPLALTLAVVSLYLYVWVYTPLKTRTTWNTAVGAIPGALPAMIGAAAVTGQIEPLAWVLFGIVFFWQFPHFWAIAWLCRHDYALAGFKMLPCTKVGEKMTGLQMVMGCAGLVVVSLLPTWMGAASLWYLVFALLMGIHFMAMCLAFTFTPSPKKAKLVMFTSLLYLPALFVILAIDVARRNS